MGELLCLATLLLLRSGVVESLCLLVRSGEHVILLLPLGVTGSVPIRPRNNDLKYLGKCFCMLPLDLPDPELVSVPNLQN